MAKDENKDTQNEELDNLTDEEAIDLIKKLKDTTVSKEEYNKLKETNKKLMKTLAEGGQLGTDPDAPKPKTIEELRKELFNVDATPTNLEYVKNVLALRDALIEKGETDPFVPNGHKISPTQADIDSAQRVADVLKDCIDSAEGDSAAFTFELQRRMRDARR